MRLQESGEMYLETIHILSKKLGAVRAIDVGEYMGYSKPSVSRAMSILKSEELISVDGNGHITLTDKGLEIADKMYERHTLLTKFLMQIGVDEEIAVKDACKIEHCISEESFTAIKNYASGK